MDKKLIRLQGKSLKGKNRVREKGREWFVIRETDDVLFASNSPGPWALVQPVNGQAVDSRWIHLTQDNDFLIEFV